jgi:tetratricopeptide (TPR) repeat protein
MLVAHKNGGEAVKVLQMARDKAPTNANALEAMVHAQVAAGDLTAAAAAASQLTTLRPDSPSGPYLAGMVAQRQKKFDEARVLYEKALQLQPRFFAALEALAQLHLLRNELPQAIAVVKHAIDGDPTDAQSYDLLGQLYLAQKNPPLAIETLSKAAQLAPHSGMILRNLALAKYAAKDTAGAVVSYQDAIKAAPNDAFFVVELAELYQSLGRIDNSIQTYDTWQRANPAERVVANNLAMMLVTYHTDQASLDRARDLTSSFESSNDPNLLDTVGWVHYKREEYLQALPLLRHAADRVPPSQVIYYHLGMVELRSGQVDQAKKDLQSAVAGTAAFPGADDARRTLASLQRQAS